MLSGNHQARNALRTRRDVHCDREWENRAAQITTRSIFSVSDFSFSGFQVFPLTEN
jgi:hypothetical protein